MKSVFDPQGDQAPILNAIIAGSPPGTVIEAPVGVFPVGAEVLLNKKNLIVGKGPGRTIFQALSPTENVFRLASGKCGVANCSIETAPGVTKTAGANIKIDDTASVVKIEEVHHARAFSAIDNSATSVDIVGGRITDTRPGCVSILIRQGFDLSISRIVMDLSEAALAAYPDPVSPSLFPAAGIRVLSTGDMNLADNSVIRQGIGLDLLPGENQVVGNVNGIDNYFDSGTIGMRAQPTAAGGKIGLCELVTTWYGNNSFAGIFAHAGPGSIDGLRNRGAKIKENGIGFICNDAPPKSIHFDGGWASANRGDAFLWAAGASNWSILSMIVGPSDFQGANLGWAVRVLPGPSTKYRIEGNDLSGNGLGDVLDGGTGSKSIARNF